MTSQDPSPYVEIGEFIVLMKSLEHVGYNIARALGVLDPKHMGISEALKEGRRQARAGLPPWSRGLEFDAIDTFVTNALAAFEVRNRIVHWRTIRKAEAGGWGDPIHQAVRGTGEVRYPEENLGEDVSRARVLQRQGEHEIWLALMLVIKPDVFHWYPPAAPAGQEWVPTIVKPHDGDWPERPSNEEIMAWQEGFEREVPREWHTWLIQRHATQHKKKQRARRVAGPSEPA